MMKEAGGREPAPPPTFTSDRATWQKGAGPTYNVPPVSSPKYGEVPFATPTTEGGKHYHIAPNQRGGSYRYETLGDRCRNVIGAALGGLFSVSHTVARVDLLRPPKYRGPIFSASPEEEEDYQRKSRGGAGGGGYQDRGAPPGTYYGSPYGGAAAMHRSQWFRGIEGIYGQGARFKLMQVWDFRDGRTGEPSLPYKMNIGAGADFDLDASQLVPKLRIRTEFGALHLLPEPELELKGRWPIANTNMLLGVRYRVPVKSADRFWEADGGARLMINLFNPVGSGFHLTPAGLEFDEQIVRLGEHTALRVAATLHFPRRIPLEPGEPPLRVTMHRLGLKARLQQ